MKIYFRVITARGVYPPTQQDNEQPTAKYESAEIKNVELYLNFSGDWKPNKLQQAVVTKLIFEANLQVFRCVRRYPISVEVYRNPEDATPLFVGEVREGKYYDFHAKVTG